MLNDYVLFRMKLSKISKGIIKNLRYQNFGRCNICGKLTVFICTDITTAIRNMICPVCKSTSRNRHIAKLIIEKTTTDLSSISQIPKNTEITIYNTEVYDSFYRVLKSYDLYICSNFFPDISPGERIGERVYCQDLEHLTFQDKEFDIVISEHVLEHVRKFKKAFEEIHRVLKTGGYHIFSIPFFFDRKTQFWVDTSGEEDIQISPPEYHGDSIRGSIMAFRKFGIDLFDLLDSVGFETSLDISRFMDKKFGIIDSYVFVSKKISPNV